MDIRNYMRMYRQLWRLVFTWNQGFKILRHELRINTFNPQSLNVGIVTENEHHLLCHHITYFNVNVSHNMKTKTYQLGGACRAISQGDKILFNPISSFYCFWQNPFFFLEMSHYILCFCYFAFNFVISESLSPLFHMRTFLKNFLALLHLASKYLLSISCCNPFFTLFTVQYPVKVYKCRRK